MANTRDAARLTNIRNSAAINQAIYDIRRMTYDPNLRSLLIELEYERASLEERIIFEEQANNTYKATVARMDLARNRSTHRELADLAEVERMGWTNDIRRRNVDVACSETAADAYGIDAPKLDHGPHSIGAMESSWFAEPAWNVPATKCCESSCQACRPISPGTKPIDATEASDSSPGSTKSSGRWTRMAGRMRRA